MPYPLHRAPSQRFRVEAYFHLLDQRNIEYDTDEFFDENGFNILYKKGSALRKVVAVGKGFFKRLAIVLFRAPGYDYVFIHREAAPLGPPVIEWILAKVLKKKIIYDFDDAIWIPNISGENKLVNWFKAFWKIKYLCKWASKVAAGNEYLCAYAKKYNNQVFLLPTCVDTERLHNKLKDQHTEKIVIGWTGSHSTMKYLDEVVPVLTKLLSEFNFELVVISNKPPQFVLPNLRYIPWSEATEIDDLLQINIGLMPLARDNWSEGKCGFKLIQYLSLGIPAVASAVGVNNQIIEEGINGYLCNKEDCWYQALKKLTLDASLRQSMGLRGHEKIVNQFSVRTNAEAFLKLFY